MNALIILSVLGIALLFLGVYKMQNWILPVTIIGLAAAFVANIITWGNDAYFYNQMLFMDKFAVGFSALLIASTALCLLMGGTYFQKISDQIAEYYALIIFTLIGAILMVSFHNFTIFFIGLETLSISLYILAGIKKRDVASNEAALKYFLMGAFATGFLLFGIALIYGSTGSFDIARIADAVHVSNGVGSPILITGVLFLLVGLLFKVSAAPFHFWAPDVYEGAPTLITALMGTVVKTAAFAAFLRLFLYVFAPMGTYWVPVVLGVSVLTLLVGNLSAAYQTNFKRLLAFSSISNAGYMLMIVATPGSHSINALYLYTAGYTLASLLAFVVLIKVKEQKGSEEIYAFNGLANTNPVLALLLTISMISLAGIPLTGGFIGKFTAFTNAIEAGYTWLVIVGVLCAVIGVFYYFKVIIAMYTKQATGETATIVLPTTQKWAMVLAAIGIVLLGTLPALLSSVFV